MKIGVCGSIERAPIIKSLGFDYVEENLSKIAGLSEEDFEKIAEKYKALGLPVYSFNCFFGSNISIYGENSIEEVKEYTSRALLRAYRLGGKVCVIGSGKARAIPEGISREFAETRFTEVVSVCADIADQYGIKIVVEPLNSKETNLINTVSEGAEVAKRVGKANVGSLVDFFHFYLQGERDDNIIKNADTLIHAHIARPDRYAPKMADAETVAHWTGLLKAINYHGALSIESRFDDFEKEITEAKECFKAVGLM
jgi:sugar phosphate isomerase/epimerase